MKKLFLLVLPLLAITFNSCSKDDDGNENGNGTKKLVKCFVEGRMVTTFEYDSQDRLIKTIWDENGQQGTDGESYITTTIVYEDNKMICTNSDSKDSPQYKRIETLFFNDAGYLTKVDCSETYDTYTNTYYTDTYTYMDNYLSTIVHSDDYYDTFTWQNGNIIKIKGSDDDEWVYEYTNIPNKLNVNPLFFVHEWYYLSAMKGTYSKNFPASDKQYREGGLDKSYTYTYTLDDDGYPTKISVGGYKNYDITITYY